MMAVIGFWFLLGFIVLCWASVRGCDRIYNPDTIRADAETRILLHKEFSK